MADTNTASGWDLILDTLRKRVRECTHAHKDAEFSLKLRQATAPVFLAAGRTCFVGGDGIAQGLRRAEARVAEAKSQLAVWNEALRLVEEAAALFSNRLAPTPRRGVNETVEHTTIGVPTDRTYGGVQVLPDAGGHCPSALTRNGQTITCTEPLGHDFAHKGQEANTGRPWCWQDEGADVNPDAIQHRMDYERGQG